MRHGRQTPRGTAAAVDGKRRMRGCSCGRGVAVRVFGLAGPVFAGTGSGFSFFASPVFAGLGVWGLGGGASSMISTVAPSSTLSPSTTSPAGSRTVGSVAS